MSGYFANAQLFKWHAIRSASVQSLGETEIPRSYVSDVLSTSPRGFLRAISILINFRPARAEGGFGRAPSPTIAVAD